MNGSNDDFNQDALKLSTQLISDGEGTSFHRAPRAEIYAERYIDWEDGMPILKYRNVVKKEAIEELTRHAMSQQYEGDWDPRLQCYIEDPRFKGMTKAEVMRHKLIDKAAKGDIEAIKLIDERLLGKPKQSVESKNLNIGYEDYLMELARQEGLIPDDGSSPLGL